MRAHVYTASDMPRRMVRIPECTVHSQPSSGAREPLLRCLPDGHMPGGQRRRARVRTLGRMESSSFLPKEEIRIRRM
jgi:hypothetical protein